MVEQDMPYTCPECGRDMTIEYALRIDSYPLGGYRNSVNDSGLKSRACKDMLKLTRLSSGRDYVSGEYIGAPGCFASSGLRGRLLNRSEG